MGGLLHLVQRRGAWVGCGPAQSLLAVPNVTAHPSTASVPVTVLLYDCPLLRGSNVAIKGLRKSAVLRMALLNAACGQRVRRTDVDELTFLPRPGITRRHNGDDVSTGRLRPA